MGTSEGHSKINKNTGFRFSYEKHFGAWNYNDFIIRAKLLDNIVKETRNDIESKILTCEDTKTYNWSTVSFDMGDIQQENLNNRKEYSIHKLDKNTWDKSLDISLILSSKKERDYFMINISVDKFAEKNRLMFYGQCLDPRTYEKVFNKFHTKNLMIYSLGNGYSKNSEFNKKISLGIRRGTGTGY